MDEQECIPVGCIPSTAVAISSGVGGVCLGGCPPRRGVYLGGCLPRTELSARGGCLPEGVHLPTVDR